MNIRQTGNPVGVCDRELYFQQQHTHSLRLTFNSKSVKAELLLKYCLENPLDPEDCIILRSRTPPIHEKDLFFPPLGKRVYIPFKDE